MKKDVQIKITGHQFLNGEKDENVTQAPGTMERTPSYVRIVYDENTEESGGNVQTTITYSDRGMKIEKRGAMVSDLYFMEGKTRTFTYKTSYGVIQMDNHCKKISEREEGDRLIIRGEYDLYSGGELLSENITEIEIQELKK